MNIQALIVLSSFSFVILISIAVCLYRIRYNRAKHRRLNLILADPEVRSAVHQLIRNQYFENPQTVEDRRSNSRRALAMVRLKKLVKDHDLRRVIYRLTDKSKW